MRNLCLVMNLKNRVITQYHGFHFDSMINTPVGHIGSNPSGLYSIDYSKNDNGSPIVAFATMFDDDFGVPNTKRPDFINVGVEASEPFKVRVVMDKKESEGVTYSVAGKENSYIAVIPGKRKQYGRHMGITVLNHKGSSFSLSSLNVNYTIRNINVS